MAKFEKMFAKIGGWEEFLQDSTKLLGLPIGFEAEQETTIDLPTLKRIMVAMGDDNPLYSDERYGRRTRWGSVIAMPTITSHLRYMMPRGALFFKPYMITTLVAGFGWEWNDVFRLGDTIKTSALTSEQVEKKGRTGRLLFMTARGGYWNQYNELVATGSGTNCAIDKSEAEQSFMRGEGVRDAMIYERGIYRYSQEEIDKIVAGIEGEKRRGADTLYWEDVKVGDTLTPVVKGPMNTIDLMSWAAKSGEPGVQGDGCYELGYRKIRHTLGIYRGGYRSGLNTLTNWPYDISIGGHYDWEGCKSRGMPAPFDLGEFRAVAMSHLLSNWMGDDGFLRKLDVQFRKPNIYGDTTWFNAEVVNHYKDTVEDVEYGAVDLRITGENQLGEVSTPAKATVYLPFKGEPVKLPIPHDDKYEECETFYQLCTEAQTHRQTNPIWPLEP